MSNNIKGSHGKYIVHKRDPAVKVILVWETFKLAAPALGLE